MTEEVRVWADSFGRWCGSVETIGNSPVWYEGNIDRIRAKIRRAIVREIEARQGSKVENLRLKNDGVASWHNLNTGDWWWRITYRETD